ncbi:MAG: type II secretion system protein GspF [Novosphingobium sp. 28-62-57]|uniref:type II secretion system inner membrane protein GspF n=1 Tax=unclassified Novosphingobium TaxID=2644732 RepID=UPI000BDCABBE|nr:MULTISPECIES: type II secretion system inner membrane protein GspF [unclassified Novosphingobium]OYW48547.1 MAG: type II secretion system protein GspF [Novosphingobium sp. 12-62-10]OYZ08484.1 MAG: type II secretion system protein GspF [Novosphingobium sp. 28-62-57]OZA36396.1 MAG: type II secretion system protein GspF [Novosphingobium sp. 17-62-9]
MARFAYHAIDPKGDERCGAIEAPSEAVAREKLTKREFYVVSISADAATSARRAATSTSGIAWFAAKLSAKQLALFTRQLSSLMVVSPLEETLRTIARQTEKPKAQAILSNVHAGVTEGLPLAEAMRREEPSFPPIYRAMIAAGENSGSLPAIADRLADMLEKQAQVRGKIIAALAYPIVLSLVAIAVVVGLMVSVVPRVVEQFDNAARQLPMLTRVVIGISQFLSTWWWALLLLLALGVLGFVRGLRQPAFKLRFDAALLRLPFVGKLIRDVHAASLARTLATMIEARLPLVDGLRLSTRTVSNAVQAQSLAGISEKVRAGGSLSTALREAGTFPPLLVYLAASGEAAGQLGPMLERAADYLEREFEAFTAAAMALLEPAIIVVMGTAVALIILAILLPILQLQNLTGL